MLRGAWNRLRYDGVRGVSAYVLTRFGVFRSAGRWWLRRRRRPVPPAHADSVFDGVDPETLVTELRTRSHVGGLQLPSGVTDAVRQFGESAECVSGLGYGGRGRRIEYSHRDWREAERELGQPLPVGFIEDPATRCEAVARVAGDPLLATIAERYFGYPPNSFTSRLYWSFARDDLRDETRADRGQNVFFHYDLHRFHWNYLYFHFYITPVDATAGPTVVVPGSHGGKPLRMLLRSANIPAEDIRAHYGPDNAVTLLGPAGSGFVMDGYCIHRATAPTAGDRLVLQVRVA